MVVEDDPDVRDLIVTCLDSEFQVTTAVNGADGLVAAQCHRPDLVLCDFDMPVRSGTWLVSNLRQDPSFAHVPMILVSGMQDSEHSALELGAGFLPKPFTIERLLETVRKSLQAHLPSAA